MKALIRHAAIEQELAKHESKFLRWRWSKPYDRWGRSNISMA